MMVSSALLLIFLPHCLPKRSLPSFPTHGWLWTSWLLKGIVDIEHMLRRNLTVLNLAAFQMHKSRLALNQPMYVGMSIFDLSYALMYDSSTTTTWRLSGGGGKLWAPRHRQTTCHNLYDLSNCPKDYLLHRRTASSTLVEKTERRSEVWKRKSWRYAAATSSIKKPYLARRPAATAWMCCGQIASESTPTTWTRYHCPPLTANVESQKTEWTPWPMATRILPLTSTAET